MKHDKDYMIEGEAYKVVEFSTTKGLRLLTKLTKLLGIPLLKLIAALPKGANVSNLMQTDISDDKAVDALSSLFTGLDEDTMETVVREILSGTLHQNMVVVEKFDTHFQGKYMHLFKVIHKSLEGQYGDFLGVLAASARKSQAATQKST